MDNVPVRVSSTAPAGRNNKGESQPSESRLKDKRHKRRFISMIVSAVLVLGLLGLGGWMLYRSSTAAAIDSSKYQAVFFTNGQVYFGKLKTMNNNYMKLTDIFYLQAQNASTDSKNPQETTAQQSNDVQLIKLGSEVHGPDDEMIISKDQVLFFENLKKDGRVTDSISKYLSQKK
jgi:hypothetical protein